MTFKLLVTTSMASCTGHPVSVAINTQVIEFDTADEALVAKDALHRSPMGPDGTRITRTVAVLFNQESDDN